MTSSIVQRLFGSLKPPAKLQEEVTPPYEPRWSSPLDEDSRAVSVRLLVYRDAPGKTRKLYFDSDSTSRVSLADAGECPSEKGKVTNIVRQAGYEYRYGRSKKDVKQFGEMVYGNFPTSGKAVGFKVHFLPNPDEQMWSSTFSPESLLTGADNASSFGSSVGSNLSNCSLADSWSFPVLLDATSAGPPLRSTPATKKGKGGAADDSCRDSGIYSSALSSAPALSVSNTDDGDAYEVGPPNVPAEGEEHPPAGLAGLRARCGFEPERGKSAKRLDRFGNGSHSLLHVAPRKPSGAVIGLAIIISTQPGRIHLLDSMSHLIGEVLDKMRFGCTEALADRRRFVHLLYECWTCACRDILGLLTTPRLSDNAWHLLAAAGATADARQPELDHFVREFLHMQQLLDTKETNFFFSTFLSSILTQYLGWVPTVEPKADASKADKFDASYDSIQLQYLCLHGVLGYPSQATRSLLLGTDGSLIRRITFVISYFLRCPVVRTTRRGVSHDFSIDPQDLHVVKAVNESNAIIETKAVEAVSGVEVVRTEADKDVKFIVGSSLGGEEASACHSDGREKALSFELRHEELASRKKEPVDLLLRTPPDTEILGVKQALPGLICHSSGDHLVPGAVLQGCRAEASSLREDDLGLRSWLGGAAMAEPSSKTNSVDCVWLVADLNTHQVSLLKPNRNPMAGGPRTVLFPAPSVVALLDAVSDAKQMGSGEVLEVIESGLRGLWLRSRSLAALLRRERLVAMADIVQRLGVESHDLPLLLAVASTHSPLTAAKYGVGFQ